MSLPTSSLPLTYFDHVVGRAPVDPELVRSLNPTLKLTLDLPRADRIAHSGRPDILLARLRDEPEFLAKCHPMFQTSGLVIRLSHLALRPELTPLLSALNFPAQRESAKTLIRLCLCSVGRVVFVNRSRVDCRLSNLREVSHPEVSELSSDTHPDDFSSLTF